MKEMSWRGFESLFVYFEHYLMKINDAKWYELLIKYSRLGTYIFKPRKYIEKKGGQNR